MKRILLIVLLVLVGLIAAFWLYTSGRYLEKDTDEPSALRIVGPVMSYRWYDGELDFRNFILILPDFDTPFGRWRIVTPFGEEYPYESSELLYYDLPARRIVLSSLAYDEGVVETVFGRAGKD